MTYPDVFHIYRPKVLTDQPGQCRFFRKRKIVNNLKRATIKHVIIHLSKLQNIIVSKSHYVTVLVKNGTYPTKIRAFNFTTVDYPVYWTFKIILSSIGFEWKKVLIFSFWVLFALRFISETFFHQSVRGLTSHHCKFDFDSMYGGLDTPYGSINMEIAKKGSLDVWITWKR